MGSPFLRRRKSSLIDGAADDARDLIDHLLGYLDGSGRTTLVAARRVSGAGGQVSETAAILHVGANQLPIATS